MLASYFRETVRQMQGYTPGEQPPPGSRVLKLNTNENPYPPSPQVAAALRELDPELLRLYPSPLADEARAVIAALHRCHEHEVLCGNGSDDLLTIVTRSFVEPGALILSFTPSYLLYETLAQIQGARFVALPFDGNWAPPEASDLYRQASLVFLANPNSPSGTLVSPERIAALAAQLRCPLVVDEAYADFAGTSCVPLVRKHPNIVVVRTLSKSYSLAGIRFGYLIARSDLVDGLVRVKDSYNCDAVAIRVATAALRDQEHMKKNMARIRRTRERVRQALASLGFVTTESHTNFLWCVDGPVPPSTWARRLRRHGILVRHLDYGTYGDGVRITIGTDQQMDHFLQATRQIVTEGEACR